MKKLLLLIALIILTSWTYEKPKDKHNNGNHNGHKKPATLPIGDGVVELLILGTIYSLIKKKP